MEDHPLAPPEPGSPALGLFLDHFGLREAARGPRTIEEVARAFARIPYENLTKVLKRARAGSAEEARRWPREVISDHVALGAGGTCFSLTAALLHVLRALGWKAEPLLADRPYGRNTHCAVLVWEEGAPRLLDPGFLICRPIAVGSPEPMEVETAFNRVALSPRDGGERLDLDTVQEGKRVHRISFKLAPADPGEFLRAWDDSFGWEMMRSPLLTRVRGGSQVYLHGKAARPVPGGLLHRGGGPRGPAGTDRPGVRDRWEPGRGGPKSL